MTRLILLTLVLYFPLNAQTKTERKKALAEWKAKVQSRMEFEQQSLNLKVDPSKAQTAYREDIEIRTFKGDQLVVLAHRYSDVVYDDKGKRISIVRSKKGKLRSPWELKRGEFWVMHRYDFKQHAAEVKITEVDDPPFSLPKVGKRE